MLLIIRSLGRHCSSQGTCLPTPAPTCQVIVSKHPIHPMGRLRADCASTVQQPTSSPMPCLPIGYRLFPFSGILISNSQWAPQQKAASIQWKVLNSTSFFSPSPAFSGQSGRGDWVFRRGFRQGTQPIGGSESDTPPSSFPIPAPFLLIPLPWNLR